MAIEIEAKLKVPDHVAIRQQLVSLGAQSIGEFNEINTFFDTSDQSLLKADRGLRLRRNHDVRANHDEIILTYKGPQKPGPLKSREEIEITVSDADQAVALFAALGFTPTLSFEKRRESWKLNDCKIELDEVPHLGTFVEIEGPGEASVQSVRKQLRLEALPVITKSYIALLKDFLDQRQMKDRSVTFGESDG